MGSALVVALVKYGLLALLWVFVIVAFRTVRSDLFGSRAAPVPTASGPRAAAPRAPKPVRSSSRHQARRLVVTEGALTGTTIGLAGSVVTLGRADDSTLVLTDDYASTRHARLVPEGEGWLVEDLGSTNGTLVNGRRVGDALLVDGDRLDIGATAMVFRAGAR